MTPRNRWDSPPCGCVPLYRSAVAIQQQVEVQAVAEKGVDVIETIELPIADNRATQGGSANVRSSEDGSGLRP